MDDSDDDVIQKRKKKITYILSDGESSNDNIESITAENETVNDKIDNNTPESLERVDLTSIQPDNVGLNEDEKNRIEQLSSFEVKKSLEEFSNDDLSNEFNIPTNNNSLNETNDSPNISEKEDELRDLSASVEKIFKNESEDENKTSKKDLKKEKQDKTKSRTLKEIELEKRELLDIHAENQRLLRESKLKLPYHQPPQMTLNEFLKKREKKRIFTTNKPPKLQDIIEMKKSNSVLNKYFKESDEVDDFKMNKINLQIEQNKLLQDDEAESLISENNIFKLRELSEERIGNKNSKISSEIKSVNNDGINTSNLVKMKEKLKQKYGSYVPRLSGSPNSIINFGEEQNKKSNLECFIEKFIKHTEKPKEIVQEVQNRKENKIIFENTKESKLDTPGAKLMKLKELLKEKMEERKEVISKKRMETYQLENEEGFENEKSESEAELTDQTDTDEEIADDEYTDSEEEEELTGVRSKKKEKSVFVDDEAEDDDDDDDDNNSNHDDDDDSNSDLPDVFGDCSNIKNDESCSSVLKINEKMNFIEHEIKQDCAFSNEKHIEEEKNEFALYLESEETALSPLTLDSDLKNNQTEKLNEKSEENAAVMDQMDPAQNNDSFTNVDTSFEFGRSIPAYQPGGGFKNNSHQHSQIESDSEDWFANSALNSQYNNSLQKEYQNFEKKEEVRISNISFEQSTEIINNKSDELSHFMLSDEESQNEYNLTKKEKLPVGLRNILDGDSHFTKKTDIISLCSGSFPDTFEGTSNVKEIEASQANSQNMQDLLALCSGKFENSQNLQKDKNEDISDDSNSSVEINYRKKQKNFYKLSDDSESEKSLNLNDNENDSDKENELNFKNKDENITIFSGFRDLKRGGIRDEFIEDEAELSGTDVSEDEKEEDEDDDEFEEVNLLSDENLSEDELKNQVERLHHKAILDEDNRELLLLQERYLPDGDLHSDGQGRQRKFRWKNIDDDLEIEISDKSSEEDNEIEEKNEIWRIKRFEREKWFQEQQESGNTKLFSPDKTMDLTIFSKDTTKKVNIRKDSFNKENVKGKTISNNFSTSFLAKGKEFLSRLAVNLKKEDEGIGRRCTKNIIFQTSVSEETKVQPSKRKPEITLSQSKRLKCNNIAVNPENKSSIKNSVFDYLDVR